MNFRSLLILPAILLVVAIAPAQEPAGDAAKPSFGEVAQGAQARLERAIAELNALREQAAAETIPLSRELSALEAELAEVRLEYQQTTRLLDSRTLDLTNLQREIRAREQETAYLSTLLGEYIRNFESRLHIAELQRFKGELEQAKLAAEDDTLAEHEVFAAQTDLLLVSLNRLEDALGGTRFMGTAVGPDSLIKTGTFLMFGPAALFAAKDGSLVGTADQRLGSLEPTVLEFADSEDTQVAATLIQDGNGFFPLDPTLGNAHKIEETEETFAEHVAKGGPVMYPIFALAGVSLFVALCKWLSFVAVRQPSKRRMRKMLEAIANGDEAEAKRQANALRKPKPDPVGDWLFGAIFGAIFGYAVHTVAGFGFAQSIAPAHVPRLVEFPLLGFVAATTVAFAAIQFLVRLIFGYSPVGRMLHAGTEHLEYPPELIEEIMYEQVLATRIKLESFLPLIAISAAAAPLLGLLGTVTGIINTFKLITVFGSGDVKTLSGGISEALVTTEFGLIAAIPALLIHAFLARKARSVINEMERAGVKLINQVVKTPIKNPTTTPLRDDIDSGDDLTTDLVDSAPAKGKATAKESAADEEDTVPAMSKQALEGGSAT